MGQLPLTAGGEGHECDGHEVAGGDGGDVGDGGDGDGGGGGP
jgi:hypothetical protein